MISARPADRRQSAGRWPQGKAQPETSPARTGLDQALQRLALPLPADIIECSAVYSMQQLIQLTDAIMVLS